MKLRFFSVGFGKIQLETLNKIADEMPNGQVSHAFNQVELQDSLMRIIPNVYQGQEPL